MVSGAIDGLVQSAVFFILLWALWAFVAASQGNFDGDAASILIIVFTVLALVAVPAGVETMTRGRSLGKLVMGIRVVRDDGGPVRFRHCLVRALTGVFELWFTFGSVATVVAFFNSKGKRIGDLLAGTYAIRVRGARIATLRLQVPPDLAMWASHSDMRPLPDSVALAARQFLSRAGQFTPDARMRLAQQIAASLEPYVAPGPPAGTHPEAFIAAVLATRMERDLARATAQEHMAVQRREQLSRLPFGIIDAPK
ncbi:putative RDD family membrane protein YckC [Rarobacter incanus]|uniref:Putative RDD family membrane protein YckC n=2 Tax=Rarobacter incanus TaxID=153494 RepID=A0A542SPM1_9MICO|nr:putative RDD family membrane protein YckC [Rarobacter incanus]